MAIHVGWPDLSNARRRSLCNLIDKLKDRVQYVKELEEILGSCHPLSVDAVSEAISGYDQVRNLAELQFPEIRCNLDEVKPTFATSNATLHRHIKDVDNRFSLQIGCSAPELRHFYDTGSTSGTLAKLVQTLKKPRASSPEARKVEA